MYKKSPRREMWVQQTLIGRQAESRRGRSFDRIPQQHKSPAVQNHGTNSSNKSLHLHQQSAVRRKPRCQHPVTYQRRVLAELLSNKTLVVKENVGQNWYVCIRSPHGENPSDKSHSRGCYVCSWQFSTRQSKIRTLHNKWPQIDLCPCCLKEHKDHHHFVHCLSNPSRAEAVEKLMKAIRLDDLHPYGTANSSSQNSHQPHLNSLREI
jgi:hypothetical protein